MLTPSSYRRSNVVKQTKEIREIGRSLACETRLDVQKQLEGKEAMVAFLSERLQHKQWKTLKVLIAADSEINLCAVSVRSPIMANPLLWPLTSLNPSVRTWDFWFCSDKLWSR